MGRASEIAVEVVVSGEGQVEEVYLGGTAVVVMSGSISV
jgi:predicted PhzF superfamily epimerase YddE/YHI9